MLIKDCWLKSGSLWYTDAAKQTNERYKKGEYSSAKSSGNTMGCICCTNAKWRLVQQLWCSALHFVC